MVLVLDFYIYMTFNNINDILYTVFISMQMKFYTQCLFHFFNADDFTVMTFSTSVCFILMQMTS